MKRHPFVGRLALALGSVLATVALLASVELALAAFGVASGRPVTPFHLGGAMDPSAEFLVWDADLLYRLPPSSEFNGYYRTDARGYRGGGFPDRKATGAIRIVCLGDSCTFGLGVREDETYAARLQRMLDVAFEGRLKFEVLNLGVVGYSSFQNARQLELDVPDLEPDVVVWLPTGINDVSMAVPAADREQVKRQNAVSSRLRRTRIARLLGAAVPEIPRGDGRFAEETTGQDVPRVSVAEYEDNLRAAIAASAEHGIRLLIVDGKLNDTAYASAPSLHDREKVTLRVARELKVPVADARRELQAIPIGSALLDQVHPTASGHQCIATAIFRALASNPALIPDSARVQFLRRYLAAREQGISNLAVWPKDAPPAFAAILAALESPRGPRGGRSTPAPAALDFDPMAGPKRRPYGSGALALSMFDSETDPDDRARFDEIEAQVLPKDPFRRFLFGARDPQAVPSGVVVFARALASFDAQLGATPPPVDRRLDEAAAAVATGDFDGAFTLLKSALALEPSNLDALEQLATAGFKGNKLEHATFARDRLRDLAPDSAQNLTVAGLLALRQHREREAAWYLRQAVGVRPMSPTCQFGLGHALLATGEFEEAERAFQTAVAISPALGVEANAARDEIARRRARTER